MENILKRPNSVVGIDLGTSTSIACIFSGGNYAYVPNPRGSFTTPSIVGFRGKEILFGEDATQLRKSSPESVYHSSKRLIGLKYDDPEVQSILSHWQAKVVPDEHGMAAFDKYDGSHGTITPVEIASLLLRYIKGAVDRYAGKEIKDAVITVPANFNESQRSATKNAAESAGFHVLQIINEPTAAAIAYAYSNIINYHQEAVNGNLLIYDLGGGTFDVTVLNVNGNVFTILASRGDMHLGGDDFDKLLYDYMVEALEKEGVRITKPSQKMQVMKQCVEIKKNLSSYTEATLTYIENDDDIDITIGRATFNYLIHDKIASTIKLAKETLAQAGLKPSDLTKIVLVGGSTRIRCVGDEVRKAFNQDFYVDVAADLVVSMGAYVSAANYIANNEIKEKIVIHEVLAKSIRIGISETTTREVIRKQSLLPLKRQLSMYASKDYAKAMRIVLYQGNSDEVSNCTCIGECILRDLPNRPRNEIVVNVEISIDVSSRITISMRCKEWPTTKPSEVYVCGEESDETMKEMKEKTAHLVEKSLQISNKKKEVDNLMKQFMELSNGQDAAIVSEIQKIIDELKETLAFDEVERIQEVLSRCQKDYDTFS